jgi:hypothetical protein
MNGPIQTCIAKFLVGLVDIMYTQLNVYFSHFIGIRQENIVCYNQFVARKFQYQFFHTKL